MNASPPAVTHIARITLPVAVARALADALAEHFADAAVSASEAASGGWAVELHTHAAPDRAAIEACVREIAGAEAIPDLIYTTIAERDWVAQSLAGLAPVEAGRFLVHGAHDRARAEPNHIAIEIEAALAFGTGHHGTTRGCLIALDMPPKSRRPRRILDVGTGTGVLAIAVAKALHTHILASDIDPRAVTVARDNARLNRTGALIENVVAPGVSFSRIRARAPYDLIFANILLAPLRQMAAPLARLTSPNGRIILSGLLASHAHAALAAYRAQGLALERRVKLDGWTTLVLARSARMPDIYG